MTKPKTTYRISVTLRAAQYNKLAAQAKAEHVSLALLIRRAVDDVGRSRQIITGTTAAYVKRETAR